MHGKEHAHHRQLGGARQGRHHAEGQAHVGIATEPLDHPGAIDGPQGEGRIDQPAWHTRRQRDDRGQNPQNQQPQPPPAGGNGLLIIDQQGHQALAIPAAEAAADQQHQTDQQSQPQSPEPGVTEHPNPQLPRYRQQQRGERPPQQSG